MSEHNPDIHEALGHEPLAVSARAVVVAAAVLFLGIFAAILLMSGLNALLVTNQGGAPTVAAPNETVTLPAGVPSVDANQARALRRLRSSENKLLNEYAWIDRAAGIARIPIARAMEIMSQTSSGEKQESP